VPLQDTQWKNNKRSVTWGYHGAGYNQFDDFGYPELQEMLKAVGQGKLTKYDAARIAGMFIRNTLHYVDKAEKDNVLLPLGRRAMQLSPSDPELARLLLMLNSQRKGVEGMEREAYAALKGAVLTGRSYESLLAADPWPLAQEWKKCRSKTGSYPKGKHDCHVYGHFWFWKPEPVGIRQGKGNDALFHLQMQSVMNRSSSIDRLLHLARDPSNYLSEEFDEVWSSVEAQLLGDWGSEKSTEDLNRILSALPVVHVDIATPMFMHEGRALTERCVFSRVAARVAEMFPQALPLVEDARRALEAPSEMPHRLIGEEGAVEKLLMWIDGGKLESEVVYPPDPNMTSAAAARDDPALPEFRAWLEMMTHHHACEADGSPPRSDSPLDEASLFPPLGELEAEAPEAETMEPIVESSGIVYQGQDVEACYEQWRKSAAAAALKEYLDGQL